LGGLLGLRLATRLGGSLFLATCLGFGGVTGFFRLATLGFLAALCLVALTLGVRLGELARGVLTVRIVRSVVGDRAALDVRTLGADFDVDRLGRASATTRAGADLQLTDSAALEGDLSWRRFIRFGSGVVLAVRAAQESEQLHLFGAADDLLRIGEFHARFAKLPKQLVDREAQLMGELFDCDVRHRSLFSAVPARNLTCRR